MGSWMLAEFLKLQHTIRLIHEPDNEITKTEEQIPFIMNEVYSPITTTGMSFRMVAAVLAEVSDFTQFHFPDTLLAYAGIPLSITSPGSSRITIPTWRSVALDIYAIPYSTQPSASVSRTRFLLLISPKSKQKENTTTLTSLTCSSYFCHRKTGVTVSHSTGVILFLLAYARTPVNLRSAIPF